MPTFGGQSSFPMRFGGSKRTSSLVLDSLNGALGDAVSTTYPDEAYAENIAISRAIGAAWSGNARMRNQIDPQRMTDMLTRWMSILQIPNDPLLTDVDRRNAVQTTFSLAAMSPTTQAVADLCSSILGSAYSSIARHHTFDSGMVAYVPWTDPAWPVLLGLSVDATHALPWYSQISYIAIVTTLPTGWSEGYMRARVAQLKAILDKFLPSHVSFAIIRDGVHGAGFYLDESHNLNYQRMQ